jgi:hypothetical protein
MAGQLSTVSFGLDRKKMIHAALKRIITKTRLQKCNCLEIDEVATHSFLGAPYVSVTAHPRHIQKGFVFSGTDMRYGNALPRAAELRPLSEEPFLMKEALERWEAEGGTGSRLEWRSTAQLALDPFLFPRET